MKTARQTEYDDGASAAGDLPPDPGGPREVPGPARRQALIVLGMHRSGTSSLTRALSLLGASLPARLLEELPDNPKGFFEPVEIVSLHDRMLASHGSSWTDWDRLPADWHRSPEGRVFVDELADAIRHDFGEAPLFVVKDPRICRFFPAWQDALAKVGADPVVVLPYRNPIEVAESLKIRNDLPLGHGYLLWLRHVVEAEHFSRGLPRAFLRYHDLVRDPRGTIDDLIGALAVDWPRASPEAFAEIADFVDEDLRHQVAEPDAVTSRRDVPPWIRLAFDAYEALRRDPADPAAAADLDRVRTAFDEIAWIFAAPYEEVLTEVDRLSEGARKQNDAIRRLRERVAELEPLVARLDGEARRSAELETALFTARGKAERLEPLAQRVPALEIDLARARGQATLAEARLSEREARIRTLRDRLARRPVAAPSPWRLGLAALRSRSVEALRRELREGRRLGRRRDLVIGSGLFDRHWYLDANPAVDARGVDPLTHFVLFGSRELRAPGPGFDPLRYLEAYPDIRLSGVEPVFHYILFGRAEGRMAVAVAEPAPAGARLAEPGPLR